MPHVWNTAAVRPSEAPGSDATGLGWVVLAADIQELANAELQELLGADTEHGHQPPRADIQKLKNIYELTERAKMQPGEADRSSIGPGAQAAREWDEMYKLSPQEISMVGNYQMLISRGWTPDKAFEQQTYAMSQGGGGFVGHEQDAKKFLGGALKKFEDQQSPRLYTSIRSALEQAHELAPESYKLWPWLIKQVKQRFKERLVSNTPVNTYANKQGDLTPMQSIHHMVDVTAEAGKVIHQLRQDHRLPQDFNYNQLNFNEFEKWFMDWKKENRASESQGEVVYAFHDGYTMQKLTTAGQLQFEGDEMGHCVGDYARHVEDGGTIIYSLRDGKGNPHATMEVEALDGYKRLDPDNKRSPFEAENVHPDKHTPGEHNMQGGEASTEENPTFEIVQIMGNANKLPKPEYQRKIKEFLDALRAKGWDFVRSNDWHTPSDDHDNHSQEHYVKDEDDLDDWWDMYQGEHHRFQGTHEDEYGMPLLTDYTSVGDLADLVENVINSNRTHQDGSIHIGDWENKAQQIYHAYWNDDWEVKTPASQEKVSKDAVEDIQKVESKIYDRVSDWYHDNHMYFRAQIEEKYEELEGTYEEDENEEEEDQHSSWSGESHGKTPLDEEKWEQAEEKVRDEAEVEQLGDSMKFLNYLHHLFDRGFVAKDDLPHPNQPHAGLPNYQNILDGLDGLNKQQPTMEMPGTMSSWKTANPITLHPVSETHNIWFDEDGNQRPRYRAGWARNEKGKMEQTGELEDTFLDKQGRQGQGVVAYHGDNPVGSLTWVEEPNGYTMLGTTYVHPDYREQGIFSQMAQPLRDSGRPIDAYVWNNPWLKNKVRGWRS